jgi:hypothetical protein
MPLWLFTIVGSLSLALCSIRQQFVDDEMKTAQPVEFFQEHEIKSAIGSLNSNKACDESGIYAKHFTNCKQRDRPFNLKGGLWFFVSFRIFSSDNTS